MTPKTPTKKPSAKVPAKIVRKAKSSGTTSKKVAAVAAHAIRKPAAATDAEVKTLAASALTQAEAKSAAAEHAPEMLNDPIVVPESEPTSTPTSTIVVPLDAPIVQAIAEETAAFQADPSEDAKFVRDMLEQVRSPVTYHFPSAPEANHYGDVARGATGNNGRPYRVSVHAADVLVSLG